MEFAIVRNVHDPLMEKVAGDLITVCERNGHEYRTAADEAYCVFNLTSVESPRAFRRKSRSVYVFSIVRGNGEEDLRSVCYTTLIRTMSNMLLCILPSGEIFFTTPEAGFYHVPYSPEAVYARILPIASATFATDNRFSTDLPNRFRGGSPVVEKIARYGREMDRLGLLPVPFPLQDLLSPWALRHLYKIYGITGASYGNLSAREEVPELGPDTFWMTGRGVNKAHLSTVGKDVLLVKGFLDEEGVVLVSMPENFDTAARVSVDAVEHALIYRTYRDVGAIVHVHAWMEGILCTRQNYPCGTRELAEEVVHLLGRTPDPSRAVVGLKNHGLTITGHDLDEIFVRVRGKLLREVEMFA